MAKSKSKLANTVIAVTTSVEDTVKTVAANVVSKAPAVGEAVSTVATKVEDTVIAAASAKGVKLTNLEVLAAGVGVVVVLVLAVWHFFL